MSAPLDSEDVQIRAVLPLVAIAGATAAAVVLLAPGGRSGAADRERPAAASTPGDFMRRLVTAIAAERYGAVWPLLHPAHRRVARRPEYLACEASSPIPGHAVAVEILRIVREPVAVAGVPGRVPGATVTFRVSLRVAGVSEPVRVTHTGHLVRLGDGGWRFVLPRHRHALYGRDGCLAGAPPR
jgi:hypothetical protein